MRYLLSLDDASRLEALKDITKLNEGTRPIIACVELVFTSSVDSYDLGPDKPPVEVAGVRAVATDSYRLVRWDFSAGTDYEHEDEDGYDFEILVNGKELTDAINTLRKIAPKGGRASRIVFTPFKDVRDGGDPEHYENHVLEITGDWSTDLVTFTLKGHGFPSSYKGKDSNRFPQWETLVGGTFTKASDRIDNEAMRNMQPAQGQMGALPTFDTKRLVSMWKLLGMTEGQRKGFNVQLTHSCRPSEQSNAYLKPWMWVAKHLGAEFAFLLMPYNNGERKNTVEIDESLHDCPNCGGHDNETESAPEPVEVG